jgi:succinate dehydrogenase/fumarate reductase cytochrome b subunit
MHLRGEPFSATDALHIAFSMVTVLLMVLILVFASGAFGKRFRIFTFTTLAVLALAGVLTSLEAPDIAQNQPTPWIGVWERISILAYMFWHGILAVLVMRHASPFRLSLE